MAEDEEAPEEPAQEMPPEEPAKRPRKRKVGGRVSLYPLSFEEAVEGLLQVAPDPEDRSQKKKARSPRGSGPR